jgi:2-polyprenyl-3-methyl-5-hydroxy-6-metoxy-1,4-benzoquinol methylase
MSVYTTEIASDDIASDNPIHQRLLKAYYLSLEYIYGDVLEVGCGEGRGLELILPRAKSFTGIDKIHEVVDRLKERYPQADFKQMVIPPFGGLEDESFDTILSFQVIEHIKDDSKFLNEIHRVLKPGGKAMISTPNIKMSLSRNPWHIREYTAEQLGNLAKNIFSSVRMYGVSGNEKVMEYHERNRQSVENIMKWDVLNLQYRLPRFVLKIPYEILNRLNRNKLHEADNSLVSQIGHSDYLLSQDPDKSLDLFYILEK